ncbi:hypothetical protein BVIET440_120071 [Burkholderia vietnamiensis]
MRCRHASHVVARAIRKVVSALAQTTDETAGQRIDTARKHHQRADSEQAEPRSNQKQIHGHITVLS